MTLKEKQLYATEKFAGNFNCAQSVLAAYCKELNIPTETAEKMGSAFGAGMGEGEICGAVSGALMVLGLKYGKSDITPEDKEKLKEVFEKFKRKFESKHGTLKCKHLLGLNLRNDDDYQKAHQRGVFETSCPAFIETAIGLIEEMDD
jgi:C_GCAxxG_C_C family probable redox protein